MCGSVDVTVINSFGSGTLENGFQYIPYVPEIYGIDPAFGPAAGGNLVTIAGNHFTETTHVVIGYWNAFLEQDPDHAEAYLERSGTHYHNKDFENALNDLKKSCDLGNKAACNRYNGLKGKL